MDDAIKMLAEYFPADTWPSLTCPVCSKHSLSADKPATFVDPESSKAAQQNQITPLDLEGTFSAHLTCSGRRCGATVAVHGDYGLDVDYDDSGAQTYVDIIRVRSTQPTIPVIQLQPGVPEKVTATVLRAAGVAWRDPSTGVGMLRSAVERVMDARGIDKNDGSRPIPLHTRVEQFKRLGNTESKAGDLMLAIKWVGNEGTHDEEQMTAAQFLEMAEMLEVALGLLYAPDQSSYFERAQRINAKKGYTA